MREQHLQNNDLRRALDGRSEADWDEWVNLDRHRTIVDCEASWGTLPRFRRVALARWKAMKRKGLGRVFRIDPVQSVSRVAEYGAVQYFDHPLATWKG